MILLNPRLSERGFHGTTWGACHGFPAPGMQGTGAPLLPGEDKVAQGSMVQRVGKVPIESWKRRAAERSARGHLTGDFCGRG